MNTTPYGRFDGLFVIPEGVISDGGCSLLVLGGIICGVTLVQEAGYWGHGETESSCPALR